MTTHQPLHPTQRAAHHRVRRLPTALAVLVLAFAGLVASTTTAAAVGGNGGSASENGGERVDVIGVFHDWVNDPGSAAQDLERRHGGHLSQVYAGSVLHGFAGNFPANAVQGLERDRRVRFVEEDQIATASAQSVPTGISRIGAPTGVNAQVGPVNADIAIIDSGIDLNNNDLNVASGWNCIGGTCEGGTGGAMQGDDDNNHGTHVAGTAAAVDDGDGVIGVAPGARLHAIKVLSASGSGSFSDVIAGVQKAVDLKVDVANMSLGCYRCTVSSLDIALNNAVDSGVTFVVAAGNDGGDASRAAPASNPSVITVSALWDEDGATGGLGGCRTYVGGGPKITQCDDELAYFSNYGDPIDLVAPGYSIYSTIPGDKFASYSGTSMASPHVAGAAALLIAAGVNGPANVKDALIQNGTDDWVDTSGDGVQEPLLHIGAPPPPPTVEAPTASLTYSCTDLACTFDGSGSTGGSLSYSWSFGDGAGAGNTPTTSHTYPSGGDYTVSLTVTNSAGNDTVTQPVSVTEPPSPPPASDIVLSADVKAKGKMVQLTWTGSGEEVVEVLHDGVRIASGVGSSYNDRPNPGDHTYQICYVDITGCSNEVDVTTG